MKLKYSLSIFASAALLLGSCSDSKWEPGPKAPDNMGVYFNLPEESDILSYGDDQSFATVTLSRLNSEEAATVPLKILECPEGVTAPASVEFAAGEKTASIEIDMRHMPMSTSGTLLMEIDPAFSNIYAAGTSELKLKITTSAGWILLADDVKIEHPASWNTYTFPTQTTSLYVLDGANRFKITNFLNSGLDFMFTVPTPDEELPYIVPTYNCQLYADVFGADEDDYHSWYFYDTANASYPEWSIDNSDLVIEYLTIDSYEDGYQNDPDTYVNILEGDGLLSTYVEFTNGKSAYHWIELKFTPKFNPFTK